MATFIPNAMKFHEAECKKGLRFEPSINFSPVIATYTGIHERAPSLSIHIADQEKEKNIPHNPIESLIGRSLPTNSIRTRPAILYWKKMKKLTKPAQAMALPHDKICLKDSVSYRTKTTEPGWRKIVKKHNHRQHKWCKQNKESFWCHHTVNWMNYAATLPLHFWGTWT